MIARDAHGCQSLYFGHVGQRWLVATEPKAITAEFEFQRPIRPAALAQYLSFSFVPGRGMMLEDLYECEAGHVVELRSGHEPRITRTFQFEEHDWDESKLNIGVNDHDNDFVWID